MFQESFWCAEVPTSVPDINDPYVLVCCCLMYGGAWFRLDFHTTVKTSLLFVAVLFTVLCLAVSVVYSVFA